MSESWYSCENVTDGESNGNSGDAKFEANLAEAAKAVFAGLPDAFSTSGPPRLRKSFSDIVIIFVTTIKTNLSKQLFQFQMVESS